MPSTWLGAYSERAREVRRIAMSTASTVISVEELHETARISLLRELFDVGLRAVSAELCLAARLPEPVPGKTLVLGIGKAGAAMARVAGERMAGRVEGIVLTRYGHGLPAG